MSTLGLRLGKQLIDRTGTMRGDRGDITVLVSYEDWKELWLEYTAQFDIRTLTIPGPIGNLFVESHPAIPPGRYVFITSWPGQFAVKHWSFKQEKGDG